MSIPEIVVVILVLLALCWLVLLVRITVGSCRYDAFKTPHRRTVHQVEAMLEDIVDEGRDDHTWAYNQMCRYARGDAETKQDILDFMASGGPVLRIRAAHREHGEGNRA